MDFHEGEWLKGEIAKTKLSQLAFCRKFGLPRSTLTTWFAQRQLNPRADNMERLAEGLGRTTEQLFEDVLAARQLASKKKGLNGPFQLNKTTSNAPPPPKFKFKIGEFRGRGVTKESLVRRVPIINKISAGPLLERTDLDYPAGFADDYVDLAMEVSTEAFGLWVDGESMLPRYEPGDLVVFRALKMGERIVEGRDYAIQLGGDGGSTFKRLVHHPKMKDVVIATPLNSSFKSIEIPLERIVRLGHVMIIIPGNQ